MANNGYSRNCKKKSKHEQRDEKEGRFKGMNIVDVIKSRRTIKKFKGDPIQRETYTKWLEAASFAPNHRMTEPWEILIIGPETRAKLNHKTDFGGAPVVFAVLSKKGDNVVIREENMAATSAFIQNFMLAAWSEGVGTFWSSIATSQKNREVLQVSDDDDIVGVLAIGYPEEVPEVKPRTAIESKIRDLS
jgi:nitroreductase